MAEKTNEGKRMTLDVTFTLEDVDYSQYLLSYDVSHEIEQRVNMTALDGTEYTVTQIRPSIIFSLDPLSDEQSESLYRILSRNNIKVIYTDPYLGDNQFAIMRVTSEINSAFVIRSTGGNRYYRGDKITLRSRMVI